MAEIDTNLVVVDVVTAWSIEAAVYLAAGLGFLAWSIAMRSASRSLAAFAIMLAVALVVERIGSTLHRAGRLNGASPLPAGARRGSTLGYAVVSIGVVGITGAVAAGVAAALSGPDLVGGWFAALGIVRVISVVHARRMERRNRVRYRMRRGTWRSRLPEYYVTSPAF
jgi:hypothetical protein